MKKEDAGLEGGTFSITVTVVENGIGNQVLMLDKTAFHFALMPFEKGMNPLFTSQLWGNSRTDSVL